MKQLFRLALIAILFLTANTGFSQDNSEDLASLKQFINDMYTTYYSASKTGDVEGYKELFDLRFKGSDVEVDVQGEVVVAQHDLTSMVNNYKKYFSNNSAQVKYTLGEYRNAYVKGPTGVAVFDVDFEIVKNSEVISKGQQTISFILKKYRGTWKITFMNRVYVQSEVYVGICYCDLFPKEDQFATFLTVPDGDEYKTVNDRFELLESTQRRAFRLNGEELYDWDLKTGQVSYGDEKLGSANNSGNAIKLILKSVNSDRCQRVVTK